MSKRFKDWDVDQRWLLPPSVDDLVPAGHLAHFVRDTVREDLDLTLILMEYREERGSPPYHPVMMTALLLYAYSQGVYGSRRIAKACQQRVDFMAVTGRSMPDFRTIALFRKRHRQALSGLFGQVLSLCKKAGIIKLGHVAIDGTKIKANASKHKAMSYGRMTEKEQLIRKDIEEWFEKSEQQDRSDDQEHGEDRCGDELPDWVADKQKRLEKIRKAKQELEAEAAEKAKTDGNAKDRPNEKAQRNFTDSESRIMKAGNGFEQCYNAQAAVDSAHQVIVAQTVTNAPNDKNQLVPMLTAIKSNMGRHADEISADTGYCSEDNLKQVNRRGVNAYVATGRQKHGEPSPGVSAGRKHGTRVQAMATKLGRGGYRSRYRLRKVVVEPVFGQIKQARGFRQFLTRGLKSVSTEWSMLCTAHNLLKLAQATS
jgi:transposase